MTADAGRSTFEGRDKEAVMHGQVRRTIVSALAAAALVLISPGAAAFQGPPPPQPLQGPESHGERGDLHGQMIRLIGEVELRLGQIDALLFDASANESPRAPGAGGGLAERLERARARSRRVLDDIDKILELARSHSDPSSGGS